MIFDNLKNKELYENLHPGFKKAFDFIEKVIAEGIEPGKYELDGDKLFASVQEYMTKPDHEKFEGHRKYIDIQFIVSGEEYMECTQKSMCETIKAYDEEKDMEYLVCNGFKSKLEAGVNDFAIFFPDDIHKPGLNLDAECAVKKVLIKIHI